MGIESLRAQHCMTRKGKGAGIDARAIDEYLGELPGWTKAGDGGSIAKTFKFADYFHTMAFVNAVASIAHRDATGILYRKDVPDDEPIVMVRVLNSTPEPDGVLSRDEAIATFGDAAKAALHAPRDARFKAYFIRVPPDLRTAHEAIAWTFGLRGEDYHPAIET